MNCTDNTLSSSPSKESNLLFSIIVCTYNRSALLATAIESLGRQTLDCRLFEILVVDNNSDDNTKDVSQSFVQRQPNLRYIVETSQGLSHARNRGIHEARGLYVGYLDDDAKAPDDWLESALRIVEDRSPEAFGGPYYAYYHASKPKWFKDAYESCEPTQEARTLMDGEYLNGTNMFFRKDILAQVGGFDQELGMRGSQIGFGEETALQLRIRERIPQAIIFNDPRLKVFHLVMPSKLRLANILRRRYQTGKDYIRLKLDHPYYNLNKPRLIKRIILALSFFILDSVLGVIWRNRNQFPYIQNLIYEKASLHLTELGMLFARLRS